MSIRLWKTSELKKIPSGQNTVFDGVFILMKKNVRTARNGNPFLMVELGDQFGSFGLTCFNDSPSYSTFERLDEGTIVKVHGESDHYQDRFSPKLSAIEAIDTATAEALGALDHLYETPPEDAAELWQHLEDSIAAIQHEGLRATVRHVVDELAPAFRSAAAAISMHHAYRHGLLEHTVHMARAARALFPLYPEVDADLALAGIILHDVGKIEEYEGTSGVRKTRVGILQGHVVIGFRIVRRAALTNRLNTDLTERLEHIILSHQGELAWGAAAMAATPEAVFVSMVDNLDAKMGMVQRALRNTAEGEPFSEYLSGLQTSLLVQPPEK